MARSVIRIGRRKPVTHRPRLSGEARKEAFLIGAAEIISTRGLEGLTMEGLAAHCGVNKALPYRHFANRDDLLVALYEAENQRFDEKLASSGIREKDFEAQLRALVNTWYNDVLEGTGTPELLQARTSQGVLEARRKVRMQVAVDFIADLIQASYDLPRVEAKLAAGVLLAGSLGLAALWQTSDADPEALIESFIHMSLGAVAAIAAR